MLGLLYRAAMLVQRHAAANVKLLGLLHGERCFPKRHVPADQTHTFEKVVVKSWHDDHPLFNKLVLFLKSAERPSDDPAPSTPGIFPIIERQPSCIQKVFIVVSPICA